MKLNDKTIRNDLFYSSVIFFLTIPVFYFVMRSILHSVDSSLKTQLREIRSNLDEIRSREDVAMLMQTAPLSEEQAGLIGAPDETNRRLIKLTKDYCCLRKSRTINTR